MALASAPNSLQPPSLIAHPLRRQVWHQQSGLAFTVGKQRNGRLFINASAGIEDSTMTSGSELHSDDAGEVSVSARNSTTSRRQLVSFPLASACACLATTLADKGTAIASEYADMPALRGKDYGKTKMKYPDYVETESGLQYKVCCFFFPPITSRPQQWLTTPVSIILCFFLADDICMASCCF
ncbi:hypothetical protein M758_5G038600 [Ceratodon purpureus]|nr:hypothetical protein M758_5G038600 [Ceratodon purpureus]